MLNFINIFSVIIIFLFSFYHLHVCDRKFMKLAYFGMGLTSALMLLFAIVPTDSPYYERSVLWQPVLLRLAIAYYCVSHFLRYEVNTARFKAAFQNNSRTLIERVRNK